MSITFDAVKPRPVRSGTTADQGNSNDPISYLDLRIFLVNGSQDQFVQTDPRIARRLIDQIHPSRAFSQTRLTLVDRDCVTTFPTARVERIDLHLDVLPDWSWPYDVAGVAEITDEAFQRSRGRRFDAAVGEVATLVEMQSGAIIYLRVRLLPPQPGETRTPDDAGLFLSHLLTGPALWGHTATGGLFLLNPANIVRFATSPVPFGELPGALPMRFIPSPSHG